MNPDKFPPKLFYIRGIIRNRLTERGYYYNDPKALELLADAFYAGVSLETLEDTAKSIKLKCWTMFRKELESLADEAEEACPEEGKKNEKN